jgi:hypothetical protein
MIASAEISHLFLLVSSPSYHSRLILTLGMFSFLDDSNHSRNDEPSNKPDIYFLVYVHSYGDHELHARYFDELPHVTFTKEWTVNLPRSFSSYLFNSYRDRIYSTSLVLCCAICSVESFETLQ